MRKIDVEGISSTDVAIEWITKRIETIKTKIATIEIEGQEKFTNVSMVFSNSRRRR